MKRERAAGRPRNEEAGRALKQAALRLVQEKGYQNVSISALIEAAGVSRQTLYNRWATKAALVLDAFYEHVDRQIEPPDLDSAKPRRELLADFLRDVFLHIDRDGESIRSLIAAAQTDPAFRAIFWSRFVEPRERFVAGLLADAQKRGELAPGRDVAMMSSMIHGAFWYRLLNDQPLDASVARAIADETFR